MACPPLPCSCGKPRSAGWRVDSYHQTLCRLSHTFLRYRPFRLSTLDPRLPQEGGEFQIRFARLLPGILSTVLARPALRARTPFLGCHNDPSIDPRAPSTCHCVRTAGKSWKGPGHNTGKGVVLTSTARNPHEPDPRVVSAKPCLGGSILASLMTKWGLAKSKDEEISGPCMLDFILASQVKWMSN